MATHRPHHHAIVAWKALGTPVGSVPTHVRPLTNRDPGNVFPTGFGLPRPMKHYRRGRVPRTDAPTPNERVFANVHRQVRSSTATMDDVAVRPGGVVYSDRCHGAPVVSEYTPNPTFVTDNPRSTTCNETWCCNPERKARMRARYATTNLAKTYCATTEQYLRNRCKTYDQQTFHYHRPTERLAKPGGPRVDNRVAEYHGHCVNNLQLLWVEQTTLVARVLTQLPFGADAPEHPMGLAEYEEWAARRPTEEQRHAARSALALALREQPECASTMRDAACARTYYKPNNFQFAQQGAVDASTRLLKLDVDTVSTHAATSHNHNIRGPQLITDDLLYVGDATAGNNLLKNKAVNCHSPWPLNMSQSGPFRQRNICRWAKPAP